MQPSATQRTPSTATASAVRLHEVTKRYGRGPDAVLALDRVSIDIAPGTLTSVMGPSGSGKSTFLQCAAGLDRPTSGTVHLGGADISRLGEKRLTVLRRGRVGFVFQAFNLLPSLTAEENVTLPLRLAGERADAAWLAHVVGRVGLSGRLDHLPAQLSGGQQQRVAIARALITRPEVIFADEPTGALDPGTAEDVMALLRQTVTEMRQTVVMVTHDPHVAAHSDRAVLLSMGRVADELTDPDAHRIRGLMTTLRRDV